MTVKLGKTRYTCLDVTLPLREGMIGFPGDPPFRARRVQDLEKGDACTLSEIRLSAHAGTHLDAPCHFVRGGSPVEETRLDRLIGVATVVPIEHPERITREEIEPLDLGERTFFRTANSRAPRPEAFAETYVSIDLDAARCLIRKGVRLVGIDALSVEAFGHDEAPVHKALLSEGVAILEGVDLRGVQPGVYLCVALPMAVRGLEAAPCRVVLLSPDGD